MPEKRRRSNQRDDATKATETLDQFLQSLQETLSSISQTFGGLSQKLEAARSTLGEIETAAEATELKRGALKFSYHFPPASRFQEIFEARTFAYGVAGQKGPIAQELYSPEIRRIFEALQRRTTPVEQQVFGEIAHVAARTEMAQGGLIDEYAAILGARQKLLGLQQEQPQLFEGTVLFDRLLTGFAQREARLTRTLSQMVQSTLSQFAEGFMTVGRTYQSVIDADVALMGPDMGATGSPVYTKRRVDPSAMGRYIQGVIQTISQIDQILSARQRRYAAVFDVQRKAQQVEYRIADMLSPLTSPELTQALQQRGIRIDTSRVFQSLNVVQEAMSRAEQALRAHGPSSNEFIQAHRQYAQAVAQHREVMNQLAQRFQRLGTRELARVPGGMEVATLINQWRQLQEAQRVFQTGQLPLGTALRLGTLANLQESLTGFTAMNLTNLQWALMFGFSGVMFQALNQIPMQSTYQTLMPMYAAAGGATGLLPLYQELASFGMQLPNYMADLASRLTSTQALLGGRRYAEEAVSAAIRIAQVQPIQFPEAMEVLTAMAIYPSLRPFATSPTAQQEMINAVQMLAMLAPEQGIGGALFAIREMLGGQFRSMQLRFNISPELLAGYAGVSLSEFRRMSGYEQIRTLSQALQSLFGGREILVRRGAQFDVQLRNISDSLINALVVPLTTQVQPALAQFVSQLTRTTPAGTQATTFAESALAAILPQAQVQGIERLAQEQAERLLANAQTREELRVRAAEYYGVAPSAITEQMLRQFAVREREQAITTDLYGTASGAISLIASGVNTALQTMLAGGDIAGGIGNILTQFARGFLGDVVTAQREIRAVQADVGMPEEERAERMRRIGVRLIKSFADALAEGVTSFEAAFNQSDVQQALRSIRNSIARVIMATFRPIAQGMMTGTALTAIQMPGALFGGPLVDILTRGGISAIPQDFMQNLLGVGAWWSVIRYGREQPLQAGAALVGLGVLQNAIAQMETQPAETTATQLALGLGITLAPQIASQIGAGLERALNAISLRQAQYARAITGLRIGAGLALTGWGLYDLTQEDLTERQRLGTYMQIGGGALMMLPHPYAIIGGALLGGIGTYLRFTPAQKEEKVPEFYRNIDPIRQALTDATISAQQRATAFIQTYQVEERLGTNMAQQFQQLVTASATASAQGAQAIFRAMQPVVTSLAGQDRATAQQIQANLSQNLAPLFMRVLERPREYFTYEGGRPVRLREEVRLDLARTLNRLFPQLSQNQLNQLLSQLSSALVQTATVTQAQQQALANVYRSSLMPIVARTTLEEARYRPWRIDRIPEGLLEDWTRAPELRERIPRFIEQTTTVALGGFGLFTRNLGTLVGMGVLGGGEALQTWQTMSLRIAEMVRMGIIPVTQLMQQPTLFRQVVAGLYMAGERPEEYFRTPYRDWQNLIFSELSSAARTGRMLTGLRETMVTGAAARAPEMKLPELQPIQIEGLTQLGSSAQNTSSSLNNLSQAADKAAAALGSIPQRILGPDTATASQRAPTGAGDFVRRFFRFIYDSFIGTPAYAAELPTSQAGTEQVKTQPAAEAQAIAERTEAAQQAETKRSTLVEHVQRILSEEAPAAQRRQQLAEILPERTPLGLPYPSTPAGQQTRLVAETMRALGLGGYPVREMPTQEPIWFRRTAEGFEATNIPIGGDGFVNLQALDRMALQMAKEQDIPFSVAFTTTVSRLAEASQQLAQASSPTEVMSLINQVGTGSPAATGMFGVLAGPADTMLELGISEATQAPARAISETLQSIIPPENTGLGQAGRISERPITEETIGPAIAPPAPPKPKEEERQASVPFIYAGVVNVKTN